MRLLRALGRMMHAKLEQAVSRDLRTHHGIDWPAEQAGARCVGCPDSAPLTDPIVDYMHLQSHRIHVLQWQGAVFAAKVRGDDTTEPAAVTERQVST